jgi:hypothetical protein
VVDRIFANNFNDVFMEGRFEALFRQQMLLQLKLIEAEPYNFEATR